MHIVSGATERQGCRAAGLQAAGRGHFRRCEHCGLRSLRTHRPKRRERTEPKIIPLQPVLPSSVVSIELRWNIIAFLVPRLSAGTPRLPTSAHSPCFCLPRLHQFCSFSPNFAGIASRTMRFCTKNVIPRQNERGSLPLQRCVEAQAAGQAADVASVFDHEHFLHMCGCACPKPAASTALSCRKQTNSQARCR